MSTLTPAQIADKHARRLKGATEDIRLGVQGVTEAPTKKAAAAVEKMRLNFNRAIDSGKVKRRLEATTLDDWKGGMLDKGINRIAAGVDRSLPKTTAFFEQLMPHISTLQSKVKNMPNLTIEDSAQRMVTFMKGMANFSYK
jgi:hypothetical protein